MAKKIKSYSETELIKMFSLTRLSGKDAFPLLSTWLNNATSTLDSNEMAFFEDTYQNAKENIIGWQEEDLKMLLIAPILILAKMRNTKRYRTFLNAPWRIQLTAIS
jgi:hypothetical protein